MDTLKADELKNHLLKGGWRPTAKGTTADWWWCVVLAQIVEPGTKAELFRSATLLADHYGVPVGPEDHPCFHLGFINTYKYFARRKRGPKVGNWSFERITPICLTHGVTGLAQAADCSVDCSYGFRLAA